MDFRVKKIRKKIKASSAKINKEINPGNPRKKIGIKASIFISILIIVILFTGIVKAIKRIDFSVFLTIAGDELLKDDYGHTNFLLLGTAGENYEGSKLTDSIIIASLDHKDKYVTMLSIPRDLYIDDELVGSSKINEIFLNAGVHYGNEIDAIDHTVEKIEEVAGIPIHYWAKIDFKGFKEFVDAIDGIDIVVEDAIYDTSYPKNGTFDYETFSISEGPQHLDGETALKFARSRHTTSDFDRAKRQQQIIFAIKEQALSTQIIFSTEKINNILDTLKDNIDTNITTKEILTLGGMADDFTKDKIVHKLIHDDPTQCGGFLYTPERKYYGGMFVLIPAGGLDYIHRYADLNFHYPQVEQEDAKIHLLNGTSTVGIAGETKMILKRHCFDVIRYGNASTKEVQFTTYYYKQKYDEKGKEVDSRPLTLDWLQSMIPGKESTIIPEDYREYAAAADIIIEIGEDYVSNPAYVDDPFYYLPAATTTTTETTEETTETTNED